MLLTSSMIPQLTALSLAPGLWTTVSKWQLTRMAAELLLAFVKDILAMTFWMAE
jgi:hypothetical protein